MRDIGGFIALLLIIFITLYLTVRYAIPLVLLYAGGTVVFFLVAGLLMRRGLRHPIHLGGLLKPGFAPAIALLALLIPALHAGFVMLLNLSEAWILLGAANTVLPVIWTTRAVVLHARQSPRFLREGHDIEEVVEGSRDRAGLLDLKIELLAAAQQSRQAPEPWEEAAGIMDGSQSNFDGQIGRLTLDMKQLRAGYLDIADRLSDVLDGIRSGTAGRKDSPVPMARFKELNALWETVSRDVSAVLDERTGYSPSGWD